MYIETVSKLKGSKKKKWQELLSTTELHDDRMPDSVVLVWDDDDLIATGSREKNILKYLSVSPNRQGEDLLSVVLTNLRKDAFENGYNHLFLYTKPSNKFIFTSLFFYPIVETDKVLFMENKQSGISDFISKLPLSNANEINGAIVMNCNPFTLGHQYLIESAAASCDRIFIFVLSEEGDGFSFKDRLEMVKAGTAHLSNVTVLTTGPYLISSATFPTYFLKERDSANRVFCEVDIEIFTKFFVPRLNITKRFVGTEPLSAMTEKYNEELKNKLPLHNIDLIEIPRKEKNGTAISASAVRDFISKGDIESVKKIVPNTTFEYLKNNNLI